MSEKSLGDARSVVTAAKEIDDHMQSMAAWVPKEAKFQPVYKPYQLLAIEGKGSLHSIYQGVKRTGEPAVDHRYMSLAVKVDGPETKAFFKEFELYYDANLPGGALHELAATDPMDLIGAPVETTELLTVIRALRLLCDESASRQSA